MEYNKKVLLDSKEKRMKNIDSFSNLPRTDLEYKIMERKLLLYTTQSEEKIYIQFPGKETQNSDSAKVRPWDFRPKIELVDGTSMKDLSFSEIWDDLSSMNEVDKKVSSVLASLFFKMAFMCEYELTNEKCNYYDIDIQCNKIKKHKDVYFKWYKPLFDLKQLSTLEKSTGKIRGVSLEAYLVLNDLLAQNEDCKYYYREVILKKKPWNNSLGRKNTLLTHISVISFLQGNITFSQIMSRFQKGMGVAPCKLSEVPKITNNEITM